MNIWVSLRSLGKKYLTKRQINSLRHIFGSLVFPADLIKLATLYGTDKWNGHWYMEHYQKHLGFLRRQKLNILEIGIGGEDDPEAGGNSLRMWKTYFSNSIIYGIDLHDKKVHEQRRIKTFKGSQADTSFLQEVAGKIGSVDIIIDDGSHINEHVITTFKTLFPLLNENGVYVIEDTQTSYLSDYGGTSNNLNSPQTIMGFFKGLVDGLNYEDFYDEFISRGDDSTYFAEHIISIHFYHSLIFIYKGVNKDNDRLRRLTDKISADQLVVGKSAFTQSRN